MSSCVSDPASGRTAPRSRASCGASSARPTIRTHDALYRGEVLPRKDADVAFLKMMARSGVPAKKRRLIYRGVRWFGWITWLSHTPASVAEARRYIRMDFAPQAIRKDRTRR